MLRSWTWLCRMARLSWEERTDIIIIHTSCVSSVSSCFLLAPQAANREVLTSLLTVFLHIWSVGLCVWHARMWPFYILRQAPHWTQMLFLLVWQTRCSGGSRLCLLSSEISGGMLHPGFHVVPLNLWPSNFHEKLCGHRASSPNPHLSLFKT